MTPVESLIFKDAQIVMLSAAVKALIQTHPAPKDLLEAFKQMVAPAEATWATLAIGMGQPGFGKELFERAKDEMMANMQARVSE